MPEIAVDIQTTENTASCGNLQERTRVCGYSVIIKLPVAAANVFSLVIELKN